MLSSDKTASVHQMGPISDANDPPSAGGREVKTVPHLRPAPGPWLHPTSPPRHPGARWCTCSPSSSARGRSPPPAGPGGRKRAPGRRRCSSAASHLLHRHLFRCLSHYKLWGEDRGGQREKLLQVVENHNVLHGNLISEQLKGSKFHQL